MILVSKSGILVSIKITRVYSITGRWLAVRYGIQNFVKATCEKVSYCCCYYYDVACSVTLAGLLEGLKIRGGQVVMWWV